MEGAMRSFRGSMVVMLALLLAGTAFLGQARQAAAYFDFTYLEGLQLAVTREFSGDAYDAGYSAINVYASIARFDTETNAEAGYDEITRQYASGYAAFEAGATPEASEAPDLGEEAMAYTEAALYEPTQGWYLVTTNVVSREATEIYLVTATFLHEEKPGAMPSTEVAPALVASMLSAEEGEGEGTELDIGSYGGGLWDKLPPLEHEAFQPYNMYDTWDSQDYPFEESIEEDDEAFDFGALEGAQRAVGRSWSGDMTTLLTPTAGQGGIGFLVTAVAVFDSDDNAAAALTPLTEEFTASFEADLGLSAEETDPGDLGDEAVAWFGTAEEDGLAIELAYLTVQDGRYVYVIAAVGVGTDTGAMETATGVAEAMIDADAGEGDGTYDELGGSTGGLWDKLPAEGDEAVEGLTVDSDEVLYPAPDGE
jgi:hypothetical protein